MNRLLRLTVFILMLLFGLARAMTHHNTPVAQAETPAAAAVADATASEPYNPWGINHTPPGASQPVEPKVLVRDRTGQFHIDVAVNGRNTRFLVDTGADLVALTPETAQSLGLNISAGDYQPVLRTASGTGMGAPVLLDSVELLGRRMDHQRAVVAQGLTENLLGQSVLREMGRVELKGDTMVLMPN
ncbi:retropepsin-like aspartic protease family protein [Novosphingobium rosa]|uniref:retropepsin-like aspartic protease family protein n=1 Tax=Novosphingobium rosa TaxID=76978 RepID=UPI00082EC8BC|nr:TIGR02281 family clan AA aspartic protease [Novosphingobium rosa]